MANQDLQKPTKGPHYTQSHSYLPPPALLSRSPSLIKSQSFPKPVLSSLSVAPAEQSQPGGSTHRQMDHSVHGSSSSTYQRYPSSLTSPLSPVQTYPSGNAPSSVYGPSGVSKTEPAGHISYNIVHRYDPNIQQPSSRQAQQPFYQLPTPFSISKSQSQQHQNTSLPPIGGPSFLKQQLAQSAQSLQQAPPAQLAQSVVQSQSQSLMPAQPYQFQLQTSRVSDDLNTRQGNLGPQQPYATYISSLGGEIDRNQFQRKET